MTIEGLSGQTTRLTTGGLICALVGRHKWSADVSETAVFQRIDCERCDLSIDGARVRALRERFPAGHWIWRKLPKMEAER